MNNLKYLRNQAKLSLRKLSEMTKISHSTLQLLENEKRELKVETADLLADYYQVSLDFLIGKTNKGIFVECHLMSYGGFASITKEECEYYIATGEIQVFADFGHVWRIPSDSLQQKLIRTNSKERSELYNYCENLTDEQIKEVLDFIKKYIKK